MLFYPEISDDGEKLNEISLENGLFGCENLKIFSPAAGINPPSVSGGDTGPPQAENFGDFHQFSVQ